MYTRLAATDEGHPWVAIRGKADRSVVVNENEYLLRSEEHECHSEAAMRRPTVTECSVNELFT